MNRPPFSPAGGEQLVASESFALSRGFPSALSCSMLAAPVAVPPPHSAVVPALRGHEADGDYWLWLVYRRRRRSARANRNAMFAESPTIKLQLLSPPHIIRTGAVHLFCAVFAPPSAHGWMFCAWQQLSVCVPCVCCHRRSRDGVHFGAHLSHLKSAPTSTSTTSSSTRWCAGRCGRCIHSQHPALGGPLAVRVLVLVHLLARTFTPKRMKAWGLTLRVSGLCLRHFDAKRHSPSFAEHSAGRH
jgi:hypothetical protein